MLSKLISVCLILHIVGETIPDIQLQSLKIGETSIAGGIKITKIGLGVQDPLWVPIAWIITLRPPNYQALIDAWQRYCKTRDPIFAGFNVTDRDLINCPFDVGLIEEPSPIHSGKKRFFGIAVASAALGAAGYATWRAETNKVKINEIANSVNKVQDSIMYLSEQQMIIASHVLNISDKTTEALEEVLKTQVQFKGFLEDARQNMGKLSTGVNLARKKGETEILQMATREYQRDLEKYKSEVLQLSQGRIPTALCSNNKILLGLRQILESTLSKEAPLESLLTSLCSGEWRLVHIESYTVVLGTEIANGKVIVPLFRISPLPYLEGATMITSPPTSVNVFADHYTGVVTAVSPRPGSVETLSIWTALDDNFVFDTSESKCYKEILVSLRAQNCPVKTEPTKKGMIVMLTEAGCLWVSGGGSFERICNNTRTNIDIKAHMVICPSKGCVLMRNGIIVLSDIVEATALRSSVFSGDITQKSVKLTLNELPVIIRSKGYDKTLKELKHHVSDFREDVSRIYKRNSNMTFERIKQIEDIVDLNSIINTLSAWKWHISGALTGVISLVVVLVIFKCSLFFLKKKNLREMKDYIPLNSM